MVPLDEPLYLPRSHRGTEKRQWRERHRKTRANGQWPGRLLQPHPKDGEPLVPSQNSPFKNPHQQSASLSDMTSPPPSA